MDVLKKAMSEQPELVKGIYEKYNRHHEEMKMSQYVYQGTIKTMKDNLAGFVDFEFDIVPSDTLGLFFLKTDECRIPLDICYALIQNKGRLTTETLNEYINEAYKGD